MDDFGFGFSKSSKMVVWRTSHRAEGIIHLASSVSFMLAACCCISLLLTSMSPLVLARDAAQRAVANALAAYFIVSGFSWLFGALPVPMAGYGLSFTAGWMIGAVALLMRS
jgi:hypothetical protein